VNSNLYNSSSIDYGIEQYFQTEDSWMFGHTHQPRGDQCKQFPLGKLRRQAPEGSAAPPASVVSALGLTGTFTTFTASARDMAECRFGTGGFTWGGGPVNSYSGSDNPNWEFADSFTTVRGKHTIGLGIDYRRWRLIRNLDDDFYGDWTFSGKTAPINTVGAPTPIRPSTAATAVRHRQCRRRYADRLLQRGRWICAWPFEPKRYGW